MCADLFHIMLLQMGVTSSKRSLPVGAVETLKCLWLLAEPWVISFGGYLLLDGVIVIDFSNLIFVPF